MADDDRSWRPDRRCRALPADQPPPLEQPSTAWRARCWPCSWRWRAGRNGGCSMKPLWQNVEQKAPDELVGAERHCAVPRRSVAAVLLVAEGHAALVESNEATVRDGDAMGVAGEIGKHCFWPGEGRLGVDEPI